MSKTLKVIFTLSILFNIAFAGLVSGHYAKQMKRWDQFREELAPETQELMKATFKEKRDAIRKKKKVSHEKLGAIAEILNAEEFSEDEFKAAIEDWRIFQNKVIDGKAETMIGMALQLPQAERQKLSKRFVHILSGRGGRKDRPIKIRGHDNRDFNEKPIGEHKTP